MPSIPDGWKPSKTQVPLKLRRQPGLAGAHITTIPAGRAIAYNPAQRWDTDGYEWIEMQFEGFERGYSAARPIGSTSLFITPYAPPPLTLPEPVDPPTAEFVFSVQGERVVQFTNTSVSATTYQWDFGDGVTSAFEHPNHAYTEPGTYVVTLTATNTAGSATTTQSITIADAGIPPALYAPLTVDEMRQLAELHSALAAAANERAKTYQSLAASARALESKHLAVFDIYTNAADRQEKEPA